MVLYPWQEKDWQQLIAQRATLPHALLLTGEAGIGKRQFAEHLAQYLLCEADNKGQAPCGYCVACNWFKKSNHPDFQILSLDEAAGLDEVELALPRKKSRAWITVEAVRHLNDFIHVSAHRGGMRVVLVYPAEAMNLASANAFLKMLEEPPPGVLFILVSHRWQSLLATLKSRCRRFVLPIPDETQALMWLDQQQVEQPQVQLRHYGGAPLRARDQANTGQAVLLEVMLHHLAEPKKWNVGELAAELDKLQAEAVDIIDCLQKWLLDSVLYQTVGKIRYYPDYQAALKIEGQFGAKLWGFYEMLLHARRYAQHPLNQRLLLEKIFYGWIEVLKEAKARK